jgi:hypothetical protein
MTPQEVRPDASAPLAPHRRSQAEQPEKHLAGPSPRPRDGHHGRVRLGQVLPGLRHALRRGTVALHRIALDLRPDVPGARGSPGRGPHRADPPFHRHRAEEPGPDGALDRRHGHRDLRLPPAPLREDRPDPLPSMRRRGRFGLRRDRGGHAPSLWPCRRRPGRAARAPASSWRASSSGVLRV